MAGLTLSKLVKSYDGLQTVHGIDLEVADGEFVVLVGPSGCGKSTTLRMIAGLEEVTAGEIRIDDRVVNGLEPGDRDIAMVFQNYALYPHLSVADNIAFGLRLRKTPRAEVRRRVDEVADLLDIRPLLKRKPRQLSGGQRQRVAMGRAIIRRPKVFLFDEPLSNLDAKLRVQMRTEIKRLHTQVPTTTVYVTHDQIEAMTLADRVVVMNKGHIEQVAPPQDLYLSPTTTFVAGFIGSPGMNFLPCRLEGGESSAVRLSDGRTIDVAPSLIKTMARHDARELLLGFRPEHVRLTEASAPSAVVLQAGLVEPLGLDTLVHTVMAGTPVVLRLPPDRRLVTGAQLNIAIKPDSACLADPATGRIL